MQLNGTSGLAPGTRPRSSRTSSSNTPLKLYSPVRHASCWTTRVHCRDPRATRTTSAEAPRTRATDPSAPRSPCCTRRPMNRPTPSTLSGAVTTWCCRPVPAPVRPARWVCWPRVLDAEAAISLSIRTLRMMPPPGSRAPCRAGPHMLRPSRPLATGSLAGSAARASRPGGSGTPSVSKPPCASMITRSATGPSPTPSCVRSLASASPRTTPRLPTTCRHREG